MAQRGASVGARQHHALLLFPWLRTRMALPDEVAPRPPRSQMSGPSDFYDPDVAAARVREVNYVEEEAIGPSPQIGRA